MQELIKVGVNDNQEPIVSARELHKALGLVKKFSQWWESQMNYGFEENVDFTRVPQSYLVPHGANGATILVDDYAIKLDMAKELAMVSKTDKGKEVRKYFIQIEKDFNSPEKVMARALVIANKEICNLQHQLEEQEPMVKFAEIVANTSEDIDMNEMAKICNQEGLFIDGKTIGRNKLFKWLKDKKILMENNQPYQKYIDQQLFSVSEVVKHTAYGDKTFRKTYITGRGQVKIVEMIRKENDNFDN